MRGQLHERQRELADLAERQHGVVERGQLERLGFKPGATDRMLESKRLVALHRGVYAVGHRRLTKHGFLLAAVLACGPGAVLSHRSAAWLWGVRPDNRARVDVTVPAAGRRSRKGIDLHVTTAIEERDLTTIDHIPVTALPRTLLDLAEVAPADHVAKAIEEAVRLRIFNRRSLEELLARSPGRHGLRPLGAILAGAVLVDPSTRKELERRFQRFLREQHLPRPKRNTLVEGYEVDAVWRRAGLVAELDGYETHGTRTAFEADRLRDADLQLAGYRVIRITWRALTERPEHLAATIAALLRKKS